MLSKVSSAEVKQIIDSKDWYAEREGSPYSATVELNFWTYTDYEKLFLNFNGNYHDGALYSHWEKWYCEVKIYEDNTATFSQRIDPIQRTTFPVDTPINITENVSVWKSIKGTVKVYNPSSWRTNSTSWIATLYTNVMLIDYKKIKAFSIINIWEKLKGYLFGLLPNGEWRDGN